jgi:hypothetical protein
MDGERKKSPGFLISAYFCAPLHPLRAYVSQTQTAFLLAKVGYLEAISINSPTK